MRKAMFVPALLIMFSIFAYNHRTQAQVVTSDGSTIILRSSDGTVVDGEPFRIILERKDGYDEKYEYYGNQNYNRCEDKYYEYDRCRHDNGKHKGWYKKHKKKCRQWDD